MSRKKRIKLSTLGARITSIVSVSLVLLLVGAMAMSGIIATSLSRSIRDNVTLIVKMDPMMADSTARGYASVLEGSAFCDKYKYVSADEVFAQEVEENPDILDFGENPFSAEYEVTMAEAYASADSVAAVAARLEASAPVDEVVTQIDTVHTINSVLHRAIIIMAVIGLVLLAISLVLIFNTVSLAVYSRRFTIHTMQLVGATAAFIRRPFVRSGLLWGLISGFIASALLTALMVYARGTGIEIFTIPSLCSFVGVCAGLLVLGMLICSLSAHIATTRYIGADIDRLYN